MRDLSEKEPVGRVIGLDGVFVAEPVQKRSKTREVAIVDFEPGEHTPEIGPMIPVVEQADVPPPRERVQEIGERPWTLGKLEAAQTLVLHFGGVTANHMADVKLGHFVVRQIDRFVARVAKVGDKRVGILA